MDNPKKHAQVAGWILVPSAILLSLIFFLLPRNADNASAVRNRLNLYQISLLIRASEYVPESVEQLAISNGIDPSIKWVLDEFSNRSAQEFILLNTGRQLNELNPKDPIIALPLKVNGPYLVYMRNGQSEVRKKL